MTGLPRRFARVLTGLLVLTAVVALYLTVLFRGDLP